MAAHRFFNLRKGLSEVDFLGQHCGSLGNRASSTTERCAAQHKGKEQRAHDFRARAEDFTRQTLRDSNDLISPKKRIGDGNLRSDAAVS